LLKIRGLSQELYESHLMLKKNQVIAEILRIGEHISKRKLASPAEVTEKLGTYIDQFITRTKT
jgi:hypothetical protein